MLYSMKTAWTLLSEERGQRSGGMYVDSPSRCEAEGGDFSFFHPETLFETGMFTRSISTIGLNDVDTTEFDAVDTSRPRWLNTWSSVFHCRCPVGEWILFREQTVLDHWPKRFVHLSNESFYLFQHTGRNCLTRHKTICCSWSVGELHWESCVPSFQLISGTGPWCVDT